MRILHVLSQTELTGSEVYAASLARMQEAAGHEVFFVSDKLHVPAPGSFLSWPISRRSWPQRLRNIRFLKTFLAEHRIDIVHAHSRAASWVCHWATRGGRSAYVSTVHGRQHLHRSTRAYSVYGERVIAICENVRRHLVEEAGLEERRIRAIPNGLSFPEEPVAAATAAPLALSLLGRTSGPKGARASEVIQQFLPRLLEEFPGLMFNLAGGPLKNFDVATLATLKDLAARYPGRVRSYEYLPEKELTALVRSSSLVIASGRLAVEALGAGVPVLALGEAACHGLVTEAKLGEALASNFGDILARASEKVDVSAIGPTLEAFFGAPSPAPASLTQAVRATFSLAQVNEAVAQAYFEALLEKRLPRRLPILMYHKVVEADYESPHKTYVEENAFARHLALFRRLGFTTITFHDLEAAALGRAELPAKPLIITFDDGYVGSHRRALPLLQKHGQRAVFFLLGDRERLLNHWDAPDVESALIGDQEIRELVASGMEIGAHSLTHRAAETLSSAEAEFEASESKRVLESLTGRPLLSYAYPYGSISEGGKAAVRTAGYRFGVATDSGGLSVADDPWQVFRVNIFPHDGAFQLFRKTRGSYRDRYFRKRGK